jgi:hypothetical protein
MNKKKSEKCEKQGEGKSAPSNNKGRGGIMGSFFSFWYFRKTTHNHDNIFVPIM